VDATGPALLACARLTWAIARIIGTAVGTIIATIMTLHITKVIARSVAVHGRTWAIAAACIAWPWP
jgi:hypothetical protein